MLTDREKIGIRAILSKMDEFDLKSLAETVTNRMIRLESAEDALNAIFLYANGATDILRRKKVKKEYLFQYLYEIGQTASPNADKSAIIRTALKFWESKDAQEDFCLEDDIMICEESSTEEIGNIPVNAIGQSNDNSAKEAQEMAEQFTRWFYQVLHNGHLDNPNLEDKFGPHHFWRDCQLKICSPQCEHLIEGSQATADRLLSLIGQDQLYFNPFFSQQGIKGFVDSHGLVVIMVGGDVHRADHWVGVFEQKFGLVRDPSCDNKWKIKFSELNFRGKELEVYPLGKLEDYAALEYV